MLSIDLTTKLADFILSEGIRIWNSAYSRKPKLTLFVTFMIIVGISLGVVQAIRVEQAKQAEVEAKRLANLDIYQQLEDLNNIENSMTGLLRFIEDQRERITQEQTLIEQLETERAQLEPLLEADKETVEALLRLEQEAAERNRWTDIAIGFGLGLFTEIIVAIVIAPFVVPRIQRLTNNREEESTNRTEE